MKLRNILFALICLASAALLPVGAMAQQDANAGFSALSTDPDGDKPKQPIRPPDEMAKTHYDRCMAKPELTWSYKSQDAFCVCMTVQMLQNLTPEQMAGLSAGKLNGELEQSDWAVKVYGPCLYNIAPDIVKNECVHDEQLNQIVRNREALDATCDCVAKGAEIYLKNIAGIQLAALQKMGYSLLDPFDAIRRSPEYMRDYQDNKKACAGKYYGLR